MISDVIALVSSSHNGQTPSSKLTSLVLCSRLMSEFFGLQILQAGGDNVLSLGLIHTSDEAAWDDSDYDGHTFERQPANGSHDLADA